MKTTSAGKMPVVVNQLLHARENHMIFHQALATCQNKLRSVSPYYMMSASKIAKVFLLSGIYSEDHNAFCN